MCALLIAIVACAALASAAPEPQTQACADFGRCSVDADHSLLQAKVNFHRSQEAEEEAEAAYRLAQLKERSKELGGDTTTLAFDCGSSGSNIEIITTSPTCLSALEAVKKKTGLTVPPWTDKPTTKDVRQFAAKNDNTNAGCTVSQAFYAAATPSLECQKWNLVAKWKAELTSCFPAKCWAAGTAGNRLASVQSDKKGWSNFQTWLEAEGICSSWAVDDTFHSYPGSFTIPGTAEAAMEVETIIRNGQVGASMAFGSAGGSSAQFGVKLVSEKQKAGWAQLITDYGTTSAAFQCTNYWSQVDTLPADYLNTYHASDGSVWGVGSFLGSDACPSDETGAKIVPVLKTYMGSDGGPITTMGGMAAMQCGLGTMLTAEQMDLEKGFLDIQTKMKTAGQATFARAFKLFIASYYKKSILEDWESSVRFIAKTFGVIGQGSGFSQDVFTGKFGRVTKMSYSYMITLGLIPELLKVNKAGDIIATEMKQNMEEQGIQKDEYAWLIAAAKIGLFKEKVCKPGKEVCYFASAVNGAGDGYSPCIPRKIDTIGYPATQSSQAKVSKIGYQ